MNFWNAWLNWSALPDMILLHYYVSRQIFFCAGLIKPWPQATPQLWS